MNYEQRYKEALERARKIENREPIDVPDGTSIPVAIFPELKESEDERIRNEIKDFIDYVSTTDDKVLIPYESWIAWLEKQGEQKTSWSEEDEISFLNTLWCCKKVASIAKDENEMGTAWYAERWLKSLKDRCTWKPTEKQINTIRLARSFVTDDFSDNPTVNNPF